MTIFLLRLFVKDRDLQSPGARAATGMLSGIVGIICNLLLFALKLAVSVFTGSVSVAADAMNNLSDASSAIMTFLGFRLAEKPADEDHPYGHARFEYLSGLAVAALIIVIGFELAKGSVEKIFAPVPTAFSWISCGILICSVLVKLWLSVFNKKLGSYIDSKALLATAADSRNDVIATCAVLAAMLIEHFTGWLVDGYMGLAVAVFILFSGANLAKETISPLLGEGASPELQSLIAEHVVRHPKVLGFHDLMVHDYGPGQRFATLHVEMDQREDPLLCHAIIDDIERECLHDHNVHLVIHYDPVVTDDPVCNRLHEAVDRELAQVDSRLRTHDFRIVCAESHTNLIFDISLPSDMKGQEKVIKERLERTLTEREGKRIYAVITFDPAVINET